MARMILLSLFISTCWANDISLLGIPTRDKVKLTLWQEGISQKKGIKINSITDYMLPDEILIPLAELEQQQK